VQTFSNFDNTYNAATITVAEAFRQSVNLPFVRMMRDIVNHYIYRVPGSTANVLDDPESPLRQEYLSRFADREGIQYLGQFYPKYRDKSRGEVLTTLFQDRRLSPQRFAWAYRTVVPEGTVEEFETLLRLHQADVDISDEAVLDLFERANPVNWDLADLGYLASIHPLELWVARYLIETPSATLPDVVTASANARQDVYRWLFRTSRRSAQDRRIRFLLEVEAFTKILEGWRRLGYPFENIVPSLGTSIGSSGDRPAALGELVGIILNHGMRVPTYRLDELRFAEGTPYETRMARGASVGEPVMRPEVALVLREAMVDVVQQGTARRMAGALRAADGAPLLIGGKTGTGDNRYRTFSPGGREVESRSVNRTSTFVFFVEDRFYGVVTAYVPGEAADEYDFTSALPTQILRELASVIEDLYNESVGVAETDSESFAGS
jgi:membrane peptidoglycan carboxypeptidase